MPLTNLYDQEGNLLKTNVDVPSCFTTGDLIEMDDAIYEIETRLSDERLIVHEYQSQDSS